MASRIDGAGLLMIAAGSVFAYSGITGKSALSTLYAIVSGKSPATVGPVMPIVGKDAAASATFGGTGGAGAGSGNAVLAAAMKYNGHKYVYGGPSNPNGGWDCSSFVSYVLGHDLGMAIPGGSWAAVTNNGSSHGPTSAAYLTWSGAKTIPKSQMQAGDLLCWVTHVGFAMDSGHMFSAYDTKDGTLVTGITGPVGEPLFVRRINGVSN